MNHGGRLPAWKCGRFHTGSPSAIYHFRRTFWAKLVRTVAFEQRREQCTRTIDAALYRPNRYPTYLGSLVVGEARRADQQQGLALFERQLCQRGEELPELQAAVLLGSRLQAVEVAAIRVFDFAASLAIFRPELVAQDGEEPCGQVRSRRE